MTRPPSVPSDPVSAEQPVNARTPQLQRLLAQSKAIGEGFIIRRMLPHAQRRMVGAWCFLDDAGPVHYEAGHALHIGPHPHIGLQTFTWMIEGEVVHRDSLGYEQVIRPGQVNLMTAGAGIAHAEDAASDAAGRLHALQLWIALPESERRRPPSFHHYPTLPVMDTDGFQITLLAGSALGHTAPADVFSPLVGLDLRSAQAAQTTLPLNPAFEHAVLVMVGELTVAGERLQPGTLLYLGGGRDGILLQSDAAVHLAIVGGAPFDEDILLWWNFVARTEEELIQAAHDWNAHRYFDEVHGSPSRRLVAPERSPIRKP